MGRERAPDGIDDESAALWSSLSDAQKIVVRVGRKEFIEVPTGASVNDAEALVKLDVLEHASVMGTSATGDRGAYVWGYYFTPKGRRLVDYALREQADQDPSAMMQQLHINPAILAIYLVTPPDACREMLFRGETNQTGPQAHWRSVADKVGRIGFFARAVFSEEPVVRIGIWNVASLFLDEARILVVVCRAEDPFMKSLRRWMRSYAQRLDPPATASPANTPSDDAAVPS